MSTDLPDNVLFGRVGSSLANNVLFGRAKGVWLLLAAGYVPAWLVQIRWHVCARTCA